MKNPRKLSDQAKGEIEDLRALDIELTDEDIVHINALCWEIETPSVSVQLSRGTPVQVGGVWLWPRTIAALHWFSEVGCEFGNALFALAYCMAHGCGEIETTTEKDIKSWARKLTCTNDQLRMAVAAILDQEEFDEMPKVADSAGTSLGQLVATMLALHGGEVKTWERYVSMPFIHAMLDVAEAQAAAEGKSASDVAKQKGNLALAVAIDKIINRGKESDGQKD